MKPSTGIRGLLLVVMVVGSVSAGLETDLDSPRCSSKSSEMLYKTIIDIHTSIEKGAELVEGHWATNMESCMQKCCETKQCDVGLFKTDGLSDSGKNCYFVHCGGKMENCVMAPHKSFTSVRFQDYHEG